MLTILITIVVVATGGIYFLQHQYEKKTEVDKLRESFISMEKEIDTLKQKLKKQQEKTKAGLNNAHAKLVSLEQKTHGLISRFNAWEKSQAVKLQQIEKGFTLLQRNIVNKLTSLKETTDLAVDELEENTSTEIETLENATRQTNENLQNQLLAFSNAYVARDELPSFLDQAFRSFSANYTPVNVDLGSLPSGRAGGVIRTISADIPDDAHEILIYVYVATNYVRGETHSFKIAVKPNPSREAAFYLYAFANTQQDWSYNSDNFWLPMPTDRKLILETRGKPLFGNWNSRVKIIAYR